MPTQPSPAATPANPSPMQPRVIHQKRSGRCYLLLIEIARLNMWTLYLGVDNSQEHKEKLFINKYQALSAFNAFDIASLRT